MGAWSQLGIALFCSILMPHALIRILHAFLKTFSTENLHIIMSAKLENFFWYEARRRSD